VTADSSKDIEPFLSKDFVISWTQLPVIPQGISDQPKVAGNT
jgi:hypothetical protein